MKRWLFPLGALAAAAIAVTGVIAFPGNEPRPLVGGEPRPLPTIPPKPAFGPTPEPPQPGSAYMNLPQFLSQPPVEVTVNGTAVVLPPPAHVQLHSLSPSPCGRLAGLRAVEGATVSFGTSYVMFTLDGLMFESHIDPLDEQTLAPLLELLTPGRPNLDAPCASVNGQLIPLPPGSQWSTVIGEPGPLTPPDWPTGFQVVNYASSWVSFTGDGYILESHVAPEDADALAPLLDALQPR